MYMLYDISQSVFAGLSTILTTECYSIAMPLTITQICYIDEGYHFMLDVVDWFKHTQES